MLTSLHPSRVHTARAYSHIVAKAMVAGGRRWWTGEKTRARVCNGKKIDTCTGGRYRGKTKKRWAARAKQKEPRAWTWRVRGQGGMVCLHARLPTHPSLLSLYYPYHTTLARDSDCCISLRWEEGAREGERGDWRRQRGSKAGRVKTW
jgi:hypothetical protein